MGKLIGVVSGPGVTKTLPLWLFMSAAREIRDLPENGVELPAVLELVHIIVSVPPAAAATATASRTGCWRKPARRRDLLVTIFLSIARELFKAVAQNLGRSG